MLEWAGRYKRVKDLGSAVGFGFPIRTSGAAEEAGLSSQDVFGAKENPATAGCFLVYFVTGVEFSTG